MNDTPSPFEHFTSWFNEAHSIDGLKYPNAVNLSTVSPEGRPASRMVLLKSYDEQGFVFYTNFESRKGEHLLTNPYASMCFYWEQLDKQIRIEGKISQVSDDEADAYFNSRPLKSRIGAWASKQSRELEGGRSQLLKDVARETARFSTRKLTRPPHWSGFRLNADYFEFWQEGDFRIHDRTVYTRKHNHEWSTHNLYP